MNQKKNILDIAKESFVNQGNSILALNDLINDDFEKAVNTINNSSGRVIVSGIGKSAIIGMKIVATLNSTGTPSVFCMLLKQFMVILGLFRKTTL